MQVEINLPNRNGTLLPGAFIQVALPLPADTALVIPANALLFRKEGLSVAVVDANGTVHMRPVQIGRNLGPTIEVLQGVSTSDRLVLNPPDSLADGDRVMISTSAKETS
jgi:multidrug efflux pump subunit AcrA (membrane-fusion protein)